MNVREVECPTCGAPSGSGCWMLTGNLFHDARTAAAESAQWERERREQERDARNEGGVD